MYFTAAPSLRGTGRTAWSASVSTASCARASCRRSRVRWSRCTPRCTPTAPTSAASSTRTRRTPPRTRSRDGRSAAGSRHWRCSASRTACPSRPTVRAAPSRRSRTSAPRRAAGARPSCWPTTACWSSIGRPTLAVLVGGVVEEAAQAAINGERDRRPGRDPGGDARGRAPARDGVRRGGHGPGLTAVRPRSTDARLGATGTQAEVLTRAGDNPVEDQDDPSMQPRPEPGHHGHRVRRHVGRLGLAAGAAWLILTVAGTSAPRPLPRTPARVPRPQVRARPRRRPATRPRRSTSSPRPAWWTTSWPATSRRRSIVPPKTPHRP